MALQEFTNKEVKYYLVFCTKGKAYCQIEKSSQMVIIPRNYFDEKFNIKDKSKIEFVLNKKINKIKLQKAKKEEI